VKSRTELALTVKVDAPMVVVETASHHVVVEYEGERVVMSEGDTLMLRAVITRSWEA